jgi:hypothetical protein
VAQLRIDDGSPNAVTRSVSAADCAEVARALALVTALAIDAAPTPDPSATAPAAAPVPTSPVAPQRDVAPQERESRAGGASAPSAASLRWQIGVRATLTTPKAPDPLLGGALQGALGPRSRDWQLELGLGAELGGRVASDVGESRFTFFGGNVGACATLWRPIDELRLMPCAAVELGVVHAEGFIERPASALDPWVGVEPAFRVALGMGAWELELQGGALFPLRVRDRFVFGEPGAPDAVVHDVPALGGAAALGVAVGFD